LWSETLSRRRALAALGLAGFLPGCGFTPVYAPGATAGGLRGQVRPDAPNSPRGFHFVARIEERLGRAGPDAPLALSYGLPLRRVETAQTGGGAPLRFALEGTARFRLRRRADGEVLTRGSVSAFATYSDTGISVAVEAARADAERRLAVMLADRVAARLLATAPDWA